MLRGLVNAAVCGAVVEEVDEAAMVGDELSGGKQGVDVGKARPAYRRDFFCLQGEFAKGGRGVVEVVIVEAGFGVVVGHGQDGRLRAEVVVQAEFFGEFARGGLLAVFTALCQAAGADVPVARPVGFADVALLDEQFSARVEYAHAYAQPVAVRWLDGIAGDGAFQRGAVWLVKIDVFGHGVSGCVGMEWVFQVCVVW